MKTDHNKKAGEESIFLCAWIVTLFLILPCLPLGKYGGGITLLLGAIIGFVIYYTRYMAHRTEHAKTWLLIGGLGGVVGITAAIVIPLLSHH